MNALEVMVVIRRVKTPSEAINVPVKMDLYLTLLTENHVYVCKFICSTVIDEK